MCDRLNPPVDPTELRGDLDIPVAAQHEEVESIPEVEEIEHDGGRERREPTYPERRLPTAVTREQQSGEEAARPGAEGVADE